VWEFQEDCSKRVETASPHRCLKIQVTGRAQEPPGPQGDRKDGSHKLRKAKQRVEEAVFLIHGVTTPVVR